MIAHITSGSGFYGVTNYNQKKVNSGEAKILYSTGFLNNQPRTIATTLNSFNNSRTKKPVFHVSLSYSEKDKPQLTDVKMLQIAKDYLKEMGYGKQPFILYRHDDTKHPHVHIVTTRVDIEKGKRLPAFNEGRKSKAITDKLEIKYGLTISDKQQNKLNNEIVRDVKKVLEKHRPENIKALNKLLKETGSRIRVRDYKQGLVYYKTDESGKRTSKTTKSAMFKGTGINEKEIKQTFLQNTNTKKYIARAVQEALPQNGKIPQAEFIKKLEAKKITPVFHKGEKGIYGMSFSHANHTWKASEIDRSLSFNKVKEKLVFPGQEDMALRDGLVERLVSGQSIRMDYKNSRIHFDSGDATVDQKLGELDQYDAITLAKSHNTSLSNGIKSGLHLLAGDYGDEVDEFLRKRRKQERDRKLRRGMGM